MANTAGPAHAACQLVHGPCHRRSRWTPVDSTSLGSSRARLARDGRRIQGADAAADRRGRPARRRVAEMARRGPVVPSVHCGDPCAARYQPARPARAGDAGADRDRAADLRRLHAAGAGRRCVMPPAPIIPMVLPFSDQGQLLEHVTELTALPDLVFSSVTRKAIDRLISEHMNASRLVDHGLRPSNRILFRGPPGTGKTATAGAIAKALEIP